MNDIEIDKDKLSINLKKIDEGEFYEKFDNFDKTKNMNKDNVVEGLKTVFDPEIPVNIYDLGLIYEINLSSDFDIYIKMTLTTPNCPVAQDMPSMVANSIKKLAGFNSLKINLVWDPPWNQGMMSEDTKLALGVT